MVFSFRIDLLDDIHIVYVNIHSETPVDHTSHILRGRFGLGIAGYGLSMKFDRGFPIWFVRAYL